MTTVFQLTTWGDYALFTRPEMKVERVSYDVITPSAARAIFEAIFWKPAFRWEIEAIEVLKPIQWTNIRRNELKSVAAYRTICSAMQHDTAKVDIFIEDDRQQRAAMLLRNVKYRLHARQVLTHHASSQDNPQKLAEMFRRRAGKGQCFMQPYLGCREFTAYFSLDNTEEAIALDEDFGWMLHDMDFLAESPQPRFFRAKMVQGRIAVPPLDSKEVRG